MDETLPPSAFAEAGDMDTTSKRLAELADHIVLQPLIAANPATPVAVLEQLSKSNSITIRRAVAQNPNAAWRTLSVLACEFPQEFLSNPLIPILNMTDPSIIKKLPPQSWASLLRFENPPASWLQQIKIDTYYQRQFPSIWKLIQLHVTQTGDALRPWRAEAGSELTTYLKELIQSSASSTTEEMDIFFLFNLLFPDTVPMLKKQWVRFAKDQPHATSVALTACQTISNKTLKTLQAEKNIIILKQLAHHPRTSTQILSRLALHSRSEIRRTVASNLHTARENIATLITDPEPAVRRLAAAHPSLTHTDHALLILDEDASVRAMLATLSRLDPSLLTQLTGDPDASVRAAGARNHKIPVEILTTLAHDPDLSVRAAAASNPRLAHEAQSALLADPEETVRASLSGNARLLEHSVIQLAHDTSLLVRTYLAANPRVSITLLEQLWNMREKELWSGLARHPQATPKLLTQMAQEGDIRVRALVAAHRHTPLEILQALASQDVREIWSGLVANPHAPLDILERALTTPYTELWPRIFNHPAMTSNQHRPFLTLLVRKLQPQIASGNLPNWLKRSVFQYYTSLPATLLEAFANSPYWEERYLAATHPHISMSILDILAQDGIYYVRAGAQNMRERRQHARSLSI